MIQSVERLACVQKSYKNCGISNLEIFNRVSESVNTHVRGVTCFEAKLVITRIEIIFTPV